MAIKEEDQKRRASLASIRDEFQSRYQHAFSQRQRGAVGIVHVTGSAPENDAADSATKTDQEAATASGIAVTSKDDDLVTALGKMTLSVTSQQKPHYIEVLSKSEESVQKPRFKPNQ